MADEYDVFLSHAPADELAVEHLAARLLHEEELSPFLSRWHLVPGESRVPALERAIEASTTVAVFFGPQGPDGWRNLESQLSLVDHADKRVIPVLLPGARKEELAGFLKLRVWVDLAAPDGFERLVAGITGRAPGLATGLQPGPALRRRLSTSRADRRAEPAPPTPYRVFVSSTLCEDREAQPEIFEAIQSAGMVPCPADPLPSRVGARGLEARRRELEGCDLLLLILGWRYGRFHAKHDCSTAELEHAWAREQGIPRIVFLVEEQRPVVVARDFDEGDERWVKQARLQAFKARIEGEEPIVRFTAENITRHITHRLLEWRRAGAGTRVSTSTARPAAPAPADPPLRKARPRPPRAHELSRYLEAVEQANATTTMFGCSVPLDLEELRVELRMAPDRSQEPEQRLGLHEVFALAERDGGRSVVLIGPPGAGKSTHLRRMALWLSRRSAKPLGLPIDTVPILVPLQALANVAGFREALTSYLARDPALAPELVEALLGRDNLLFLVDGFDALPTAALRKRALRWLEQGLREHPQARFLIATEPGRVERWPAPVLEVQLPPLEELDARALVERWFRAMEPRGDAGRAEAMRRADALWSELKTPEFRATRMFELTRNPLMLTVLCVVQRQLGQLPTRRVELYEQCVQVLVRRWCSAGELPRRFGDREARQLLQPLAYWLHGERGRTHASAHAVAQVLAPHLHEALGYDDVDADAFLRAVSTGEGMLTTKGGDSYGLLHLCFQEYLCARHLRSLSHGDPGVLERLAERFGEPWWREVTLLFLALGEPALFEPLMQRVVERSAFIDHLDWVVDCIRGAAQGTTRPFVALLLGPPGRAHERWARQLAAWRVLEKIEPERLPTLAAELLQHPCQELRRLALEAGSPEPTVRVSRCGYALVEVPAGSFMMGAHPRERGRRGGEGPRHEVALARFFAGRYPVTNEEYGHYLRARPEALEPAYWGDPRYNHPRQPVVGVSWHEAMAYCAWAGLALPTEAQWEHACRAGTRTAFWSGREEEDLARVGWYADNSEQRLHLVGEREPNPFGLYDVHGNVWEWCLDAFGDYHDHPPRSGDGLRHPPLEGGNRVIRGGSWIDAPRKARSASRLNRHADNRLGYLGFRAIEPAASGKR